MTRINLVDGVIDRIVDIGKQRVPNEACGVILSDGRVVELPNVSHLPEDSYTMRSEDMEAVLIEKANPLEHVVHEDFVVWHTHPRGQVGPSPADMHTRVPHIQYLVVSWDSEGNVFPALYSLEEVRS